jgi:hypothetical protein
MLNVAQLIKDNNFNFIYLFKNQQEFLEKQENPIINLYGFQEFSENDIKTNLAITANKLSNIGINNDKYTQISEVISSLETTKENLENLKFWNYHKFWKKSAWGHLTGGSLSDVLGSCIGGVLTTIDYKIGIEVFICVEAVEEISRRNQIKKNKKRLISLEEIETKYNNFCENVANSKLNQIIVPSAKRIFEEAREQSLEEYTLPNLARINNDLRLEYFAKGFK